MYTTSYNKELKTAQAEIIRIFSNITIPIVRDGKTRKEIVPCVFGQSSRILKSIMNPTASAQIYPIIAVERGNITIDLIRNSEIQHDISIITSSGSYDPDTRPPTPISLEFTINIFSKYPEELDMILTNFMPFFNKDVFVVTPHPKLEGKTLRHQVIWSGDVSFDWKSVLQNTEQDIQIATIKLQYKTEIFGGVDKLTDTDGGDIFTINLALTPSNGDIYPDFDSDHPDNNLWGGFYAVPYSESFSSFSKNLIEKYMNNDCDGDGMITNAFNARFNTGILNHDISYMEEAVENGANIYKYSYWPYKYAKNHANINDPDNKFNEVVEWLEGHGSLIPKDDEEHYLTPETVNYTLSELGKEELLKNGIYPEGEHGEYTKKQIDECKTILTKNEFFKYKKKIELADISEK